VVDTPFLGSAHYYEVEMNLRKLTWVEVYKLLDEMPAGWVYGVPRGGAVVAGLLGCAVDSPEDAEYIVDDIEDSGATRRHYESKYPDKPFYTLVTREPDGPWVVFPWEHADPLKDNNDLFIRLGELMRSASAEEVVQLSGFASLASIIKSKLGD
jgi:hypothetical protein